MKRTQGALGSSADGETEAVRWRLPSLNSRGALTVLLGAAFLWSLLQVEWGGDLVHPGGGAVFLELAQGLLSPDVSRSTLTTGLEAAWITLAYAVAGLTVALILGVPLGVLASGVLIRHPGMRRMTMVVSRGFLAFTRAIHELVWAWLFVAAIGLSPFAAVFALAIPYGGILGRIYADLLNDVPAGPVRALRSAGAGEGKVLLYGRLPMVLADIASYTFYRFECALRSSAILGFVGLGGLGLQIQLALDDLAYEQVSTYFIFLAALILVVEFWSSELRKRLVT